MKIASSGTKEGLLKLIKDFYYTENIEITEENNVINTKLNKELGYVKTKGKKLEYHVK